MLLGLAIGLNINIILAYFILFQSVCCLKKIISITIDCNLLIALDNARIKSMSASNLCSRSDYIESLIKEHLKCQ